MNLSEKACTMTLLMMTVLANSPTRRPQQHTPPPMFQTNAEGTAPNSFVSQPPTPVYSIVLTEPWNAKALTTGAFLISRLKLNFLNENCEIVNDQLNVYSSILEIIDNNLSKIMKMKNIAYLILKLENSFVDVIQQISHASLCEDKVINEIIKNFSEIKSKLDNNWNIMDSNISVKFQKNRPLTKDFPSILVGLGVGLLGGGLLGSLFNSNEDISLLNENIFKINKKISITNERLDILAENVTNHISNIKIILQNIQSLYKARDIEEEIRWNLQILVEELRFSEISFKIGENRLTLLRKNIINPSLFNLETFKSILLEGSETFPSCEFPVKEINKKSMNSIINLIDIVEVEHNFIAIIPLVNKRNFLIHSLIPLPIKIGKNKLVIAETSEIILVKDREYISLNENQLEKIDDLTYILKTIVPIWNTRMPSCELECLKKNDREIVKLCNFRNLGSSINIHVTKTKNRRLLFVEQKTNVRLTCPDGKIRYEITGLYVVPQECDLEINEMRWPAEQRKVSNLTNLLGERPRKFDLTKLPIFTINKTNSNTYIML